MKLVEKFQPFCHTIFLPIFGVASPRFSQPDVSQMNVLHVMMELRKSDVAYVNT